MAGARDKSFFSWLKQPASWIAIVAAITSFISFYLVYADPGELDLVLPDRVGIYHNLENDGLELLLPITFTNTGAPRTQRHIIRVTAELTPSQPPASGNSNPTFAWEYEKAIIGKLEWKKKYNEDITTPDNVDYVGRAFAFALYGGESKAKLLNMLQVGGKLGGRSLSDFRLKVDAATDRGVISTTRRYGCVGREPQGFTWCGLRY
ncbi:MAG TPA: hypothetical protein VGW36_07280 [Pyrinomonadaceae bacterium]|nr:hypothetical protein [Pyrinomonadaceae bacterium]